ncbi:hypothetical protein ACLQ2P_41640 [Actinomadura citrea]|uniref:hypothetical protein n=1 Tax=Actinomadura citrea TaxID=46158 RepID=UPI003CE578AA
MHYTNRTKVKSPCRVTFNHPSKGRNDAGWSAGPGTSSRTLGVRYTVGGYALVLDPYRAKHHIAPNWGWVPASCLVDPVARKFPRAKHVRDLVNKPDPEKYARRLADQHATRGNNAITKVNINPPAKSKKGSVRVKSSGTLRNSPSKFAIGGVKDGWTFQITRKKCRRGDGKPYGPKQWVYGYSPNAGRWGFVQATHLAGCTA